LLVVLYGRETWSLTLREEHRLRVFENRVLRRILGSKRDEMVGGWRKLHNEELHNLHSSPNIITMIKSRTVRWVGHVARMDESMQETLNIANFVYKPNILFAVQSHPVFRCKNDY
jgi:hypothetical protein